MRPVLIVIDSPRFNLLSGIVERHKDIRVQAFVSKSSVETLNHRILHRCARPDEIQLVHGDHHWIPSPLGHPFQSRNYLHASQCDEIGLDYLTIPTIVIHDREGSEPPSIEQHVCHKVPTPPLIELPGLRRHYPEMTGPFRRCMSRTMSPSSR